MSEPPLRIVVTGGGSGGHITPLLAVAHELKAERPGCEIVYIGQKGDRLSDIPAQDPNIDAVYGVRAGKLRRYHGEGWRQLLDVPTMAKNLRDMAYVLVGIVQSYRLLRRLRPAVVFIKGGFVGVPVGLAAAWLGIPFVTHDSDAIPGLANRIIARWASRHAVALPVDVYPYPPERTVMVGVPVSRHFAPADEQAVLAAKRRIGVPDAGRVVTVTGGGLGAQRLNDAVTTVAAELLRRYPDLVILHQAGRALEGSLGRQYDEKLTPADRDRVKVVGFVNNLYDYSAAADVVISRAGGTSLAEMAAQAKPCVIVPNPLLTGGHQSKNAQVLADLQAIRVVEERALRDDPNALLPVVCDLLDDPAVARRLGAALHAFAQPDASHKLAMVLLDEAATRSSS